MTTRADDSQLHGRDDTIEDGGPNPTWFAAENVHIDDGVPETDGAAALQAEPAAVPGVRVLLYSDDSSTRESVRMAVGRRPARDVRVESWRECATADAVIEAADRREADLFILDGEAAPYGGLGLCRQLKNEIYQCPPILVLTGRASDGWLASWSFADASVPHPIDATALASSVAELGRAILAGETEGGGSADSSRPAPAPGSLATT